MSRRQHIADHTHTSYGDPVRREAYERAMETLRGRPGLRRNADVSVIRDYRGPVVVGDHADLPSRRDAETKVRLTDEQRSRIEALVGTYGMARFIREAIDRELERREAEAKQ
jgi:hypothetical protein